MERLKNIREEACLTQSDMAKIIGIKRATYSSYEIERDTIPIHHLNTLCNYFNISIDYALGLSNKKQYNLVTKEIDKIMVGKKLKLIRKQNNLTQKEMAKILNISRSTWTGYEYGKFLIPTLHLFAISQKYHISIDYLLGKTKENYL